MIAGRGQEPGSLPSPSRGGLGGDGLARRSEDQSAQGGTREANLVCQTALPRVDLHLDARDPFGQRDDLLRRHPGHPILDPLDGRAPQRGILDGLVGAGDAIHVQNEDGDLQFLSLACRQGFDHAGEARLRGIVRRSVDTERIARLHIGGEKHGRNAHCKECMSEHDADLFSGGRLASFE